MSYEYDAFKMDLQLRWYVGWGIGKSRWTGIVTPLIDRGGPTRWERFARELRRRNHVRLGTCL